MIRVLVADDHAVVRVGLSRLLATVADIEVVGVASDGAEAVRLATELRPHVVLMDLSMPGLDGTEATRQIVAAHPGVRVVALTSFSDRTRILGTLDVGAAGYLLKDAEPEELIRGIRAAAAGESPVAPRVASALIAERVRQQPRAATELTDRERGVLSLLADGCANRVIAERLGITEATVKAHLTRIFQRIGVTGRTQAAVWARSHGLGTGAPPS